jgi:p25-alpha
MADTSIEWEDILKQIFLNYSVSGKSNQSHLTAIKFKKLLGDAEILDRNITTKDIDILFCSETRHQTYMSYEIFTNVLPKLAQLKYSEKFLENPKQATLFLINKNFLPLCKQSITPTFHPDSLQYNEMVRNIIQSVIIPLRNIYTHYFPWEVLGSEKFEVKANKSQRALSLMLKDFDICPSLVNKTVINKLWTDVVINCGEFPPAQVLLPSPIYEQGSCFTLSKYLFMLYNSALLGYNSDSQLRSSLPTEKLLILLERMELSQEKKTSYTSRPRTAKDTLLPSREVIEKVLNLSVPEFTVEDFESGSRRSVGDLEKYMDGLQRVFQSYCSYGEPMNTTKLKSSKLIKMLKDCGVLDTNETSSGTNAITKVEVDLIFSKLTRSHANPGKSAKTGFAPKSHLSLQSSNVVGRMDFHQFLKALEVLAEKLYPGLNIDEAYMNLIENCIMQLDTDASSQRGLHSQYVNKLMEMLKDEDMIEALGIVHKVFTPYYTFYADTHGFMNFTAFIRFCKDFQIFPDILSKAKLLRFFYALAGIYAQTEGPERVESVSVDYQRAPEQTEVDVIDQHLFVEALALIAAEVNYIRPTPTPVHRICLLIERLNQSTGPIIVINSKSNSQPAVQRVDIINPLKERYPYIFAPPLFTDKPSFARLMS